MKQKGAVLLTTVVVLSMMSLASIISLQTIVTAEKSVFATNQYYRSQEVAEGGASDVLRNFIVECESDIVSFGSVDNGDRTGYNYEVESLGRENIYKITTTGHSLDTYKSTIEMGFYYDTNEKEFNANNGWGNGDQDAPGNSLDKNNAENSTNGKEAPRGIQKKRERDDKKNCQRVQLELLYWSQIL